MNYRAAKNYVSTGKLRCNPLLPIQLNRQPVKAESPDQAETILSHYLVILSHEVTDLKNIDSS